MAGRRLGDLKFKHIETALDVEEASLSQIHRTVGKQLSRLQLEERMLLMLQEKLRAEAGQANAANRLLASIDTETEDEEGPSPEPDEVLVEEDAGTSKKPTKGGKGGAKGKPPPPAAAGRSAGKARKDGPTPKKRKP